MWKRLAIIVGVVFLISVAILAAVYCQQRNTIGQGSEMECALPSGSASAPASLVCKISPHQTSNQSKPGSQWWNSLWEWPEGITAWLLLITFGAIVWQAWETSRSADISASSLVAQFRPKVVVRSMTLHPESTQGRTDITTPWRVQLLIVNSGGTVAHIQNSDVQIHHVRLDADERKLIKELQINEFQLQPGERRPINFDVEDEIPGGGSIHCFLYSAEYAVKKNRQETVFLCCSGVITYKDDIGIKRSTGFDRGYSVEKKTFLPTKDPEREYSD